MTHTIHATVAIAEGGQILSQITYRDINEITDVRDAVHQVGDLIGVMLALTEATKGYAMENLKKNMNSLVLAASEKLESIEDSPREWPSRGMVLLNTPDHVRLA
jgi:hypothetical protein